MSSADEKTAFRLNRFRGLDLGEESKLTAGEEKCRLLLVCFQDETKFKFNR